MGTLWGPVLSGTKAIKLPLIVWSTAEKKTFSNSLPASFPFFLCLLWTLTISRRKHLYLGMSEDVSLIPHWFVKGKFGFMGRSVGAAEVASTDQKKTTSCCSHIVDLIQATMCLLNSINSLQWFQVNASFLWVIINFRKGIQGQMRGRSRNFLTGKIITLSRNSRGTFDVWRLHHAASHGGLRRKKTSRTGFKTCDRKEHF